MRTANFELVIKRWYSSCETNSHLKVAIHVKNGAIDGIPIGRANKG